MKHLARKHVNGSSQQANKFLRVSLCKDEVYAYIMRLLGNSMCMVKCVDGYERLCHIRGKFTGRSKRENALSQGTWVLVGLRQWDAEKEFASKISKTDKKVQKCDLLEIYSSSEREKLRVQEKIFQDIIECNNSDGSGRDSDVEFKTNHAIEFKDQKSLEYQEIIAQDGKLSRLKTSSYQSIYDDISDSGDDDDTDDDDDRDDDDVRDNKETSRTRTTTATTTTSAAAAAASAITTPPPAPVYHKPAASKSYLEEVDIDDI